MKYQHCTLLCEYQHRIPLCEYMFLCILLGILEACKVMSPQTSSTPQSHNLTGPIRLSENKCLCRPGKYLQGILYLNTVQRQQRFKLHGRSQLKSETESTSGYTKWCLVTAKKNLKKGRNITLVFGLHLLSKFCYCVTP